MELWIRSQDKERLTKVEDLYIEFNGDTNPKIDSHRIVADKFINLGIYKSKERALEVLDEIQNTLKPQLIIKDSGKIIGSFEDTIIREGATYEFKELSTYVYEMPEK